MDVGYTETRNNDFVSHFLTNLLMGEEKYKSTFLQEVIYTKFIDWKYEEEWRVIGSKGLKIYSDENLDRVIFGLKMPVEERNAIRFILKNKKINFFEAIKSKKHFAVEIREIS